MNTRQEIISLLRGYAACPIICQLGEQGLLDRMLGKPFDLKDFPEVVPSVFGAVCRYLVSLELLIPLGQDSYRVSPLGTKVFERYGAFGILYAYRDYFDQLPALLFGHDARPSVNRLRNVLGSGQLHSGKFFPAIIEMLGDDRIDTVVDIGCGDGHFLSSIRAVNPAIQLVAVDISPVAVNTTVEHLKDTKVHGIVANGFDVERWALSLPASPGRMLVSAWFVLHEFSHGQQGRAVNFLRKLYKYCAGAHVLVGELVSVPDIALAADRANSIMPEFLLFHALSGQGVLTWEQHLQVRSEIPYEVVAERHFDVVPVSTAANVPSSFIWYLQPRSTPVS
jgi:SAM-dependent methyltransferase